MTHALSAAAYADSKKPYGNVTYADPSTGRLFPRDVNTAEEIRAYMARIIRQDRNRWSLQ